MYSYAFIYATVYVCKCPSGRWATHWPSHFAYDWVSLAIYSQQLVICFFNQNVRGITLSLCFMLIRVKIKDWVGHMGFPGF